MFVNKKMTELFKQLKIKDDTQFLSMLENYYDQMDGDEGKMLEQLQKESIYRLVPTIDFEYDCMYCFEQVDSHHKKQPLHENIVVINEEQ